MSLFGTIQTASTGLQASQIGLQVVGNNIANANTPGFIRQRLNVSPTIATGHGQLLLGHGVRPMGVTQMIDKAVMERMFTAGSAKAAGEILDRAYNDLELLVGSLTGSGIPEMLSSFNNALHDLSATPNDRSLRDFVILRGDALAREIRTLHQAATDLQGNINGELGAIANSINEKTVAIAKLNVAIAGAEGGGVIGSDASGLREQRYGLIEQLAELVDINIQEQGSGTISVFVGGEFLVSEGQSREVKSAYNDALKGFEIRIKQSDSPLQSTGGRYGALMQARGEVYGGFIEDMNALASGLVRAVNEIHTQGQGRRGFETLTAINPVLTGVPLKDSSLSPSPQNGSFNIQLVDAAGQPVSYNRIDVRALGQVGDSTIDSVVADIDAIDGLSARVNSDGRLVIQSTAPGVSFTFANDSSGFLSSVGLNTFFVGSTAKDLTVNPLLKQNSDFLAVSSGGIGMDTAALMSMVDLVDRPLEALQGRSVRRIFDENVTVLGQRISLQRSLTQGASDLHASLQGQHLGITGVNIDEESILMLAYNRAFQANAKVISTASEMLEILMRI